MKTKEKTLGIIALLLLLYLIYRGRVMGASQGFIINGNTGLPVAPRGLVGDSKIIGEAVFPPSITNDVSNPNNWDAMSNPAIPLCPTGSGPIIDPTNNKVYCRLLQSNGLLESF